MIVMESVRPKKCCNKKSDAKLNCIAVNLNTERLPALATKPRFACSGGTAMGAKT